MHPLCSSIACLYLHFFARCVPEYVCSRCTSTQFSCVQNSTYVYKFLLCICIYIYINVSIYMCSEQEVEGWVGKRTRAYVIWKGGEEGGPTIESQHNKITRNTCFRVREKDRKGGNVILHVACRIGRRGETGYKTRKRMKEKERRDPTTVSWGWFLPCVCMHYARR